MKSSWAEPDVRDEVVDYIRYWSDKTGIKATKMIRWIGIHRSKYYDWASRYGKVNEHNAWIPRDFWLAGWEKQAIIDYYYDHPLEGYRRLTYMMMDDDVVAVSPSSVYRVLTNASLLSRWNRKPSKKGTGFHQPLRPHEHWHIDISYINICGTFYYLCSILDGFSRYIVHWEIRQAMTEADVEIILQRGREKFPDAKTGADSGAGLYSVSGGVTPMGAILASQTNLYLLQGRLPPYSFNRFTGSALGTIGERGQSGCYALLTPDSRFVRGNAKFHEAGYELAEHNTESKDHIATHPNGRRLVVSGNTAYLLTKTSLSAIRRNNGSLRWSVPCDCPYALILAGDVLFAGGTNKVIAYSTTNGNELWCRTVNGRARGLAAADGRLFVSTDTGSIHMFAND